jgi:hypothetical protein
VRKVENNYNSRFATTREELEIVLDLRRAYFRDKPVSPDQSYRISHEKNSSSMKLVCSANGPTGYWSLIPTNESAYRLFLEGKQSHEQMLTEHCLPWTSVDQSNAYIYVVGAVEPTGNPVLATYVMLDWIAFISDLLQHMSIKGFCGYPSRDNGYRQFEKFGFTKSDVLIDNDPEQPIFLMEGDRIKQFKTALDMELESKRNRVPLWDKEDRREFYKLLRFKDPDS